MPLSRLVLSGLLLASLFCGETAIAARSYKLLIVMPASQPSGSDVDRVATFTSWGFQPSFASQDQTREELLTAAANSDVCFISERCDPRKVAQKLKDSPVGIVTDDYQLAGDFALAKKIKRLAYTGAAIVAEPSHAIMAGTTLDQPLPDLVGNGEIYVSQQVASGATVLTTFDGNPHFLAVEKATPLIDDTWCAGRRVLLGHCLFDRADDEVREMYRQALTWAANPRGFAYYVRKSGNNSNDGRSRTRAFRTVAHAAKIAAARDVVYVGAGTYSGTVQIVNGGCYRRTLRFIVDKGLRAADEGEVIIEGAKNIPALVNADHRFDTQFDGFTFRKSKNLMNLIGGDRLSFYRSEFEDAKQFAVNALGAKVSLISCNVRKCNDGGIATLGGLILFESGTIEKVTRSGLAAKDPQSRLIVRDARFSDGQAAISWLDDGWGSVDRCTISKTKNAGIFFLNSGNVTVRDCTIEDNKKMAIHGQLTDVALLIVDRCRILRNGDDGIQTDRGVVNVTNCLIANNKGDGLRLNGGSETIYHNTIADNKGAGVDTKSSRYFRFYNNIVYRNGSSGIRRSLGRVAHDYNLVYGNKVDFHGVTPGANSVLLDPAFDATNSDYQLGDSSPAIDLASNRYLDRLDLTKVTRPQGAAGDLGCHESRFKRRVKILEWTEIR